MINEGAFAEYKQVESLLGALPSNLRVKVTMKLTLDPRDTSTLIYDTHFNHVLVKYVTPDALTLRDSESARTPAGFSPDPFQVGFPLPHVLEVVKLRLIPTGDKKASSKP
jgi:hypothetical protein